MAERERKEGFVYIKSEILKQEIAVSKKTGWVFCEDKVCYSPKEIAIMKEVGTEIDLCTHLVKKVFDGEVVKIERSMGTNGQAKPIESGGGAGAANNSSAGEKIQSTDGVGAGDGGRELEIY
jgi:hypothetical protein